MGLTFPPIGTVILKGACVVDAKGHDVFCGDTVVDAFCHEHTVMAIEPIDENHAWIIDQNKTRLIPHLTEKITDPQDENTLTDEETGQDNQ